MRTLRLISIVAVAMAAPGLAALPAAQETEATHQVHPAAPLFETSDSCLACHNGLTTPSGEDVSIGSAWRASMMANSGRDPYWQAAVRREILDHPQAQGAIEDKCSTCHMPMARYEAASAGGLGQVFANLPVGKHEERHAHLAADGVSCSMCHQITADRLGTEESFTGGFVVDTARPPGERRVYGPFDVDDGRAHVMQSATGFRPTEATHLRDSELCGSCHTLFTETLDANSHEVGQLPEQMPYLEWEHSTYRGDQSCQSCHMPVVEVDMPISSVLGDPREGLSRHVFRGGNFFMTRILNRYRHELGVAALPVELDAAANRTVAHLQTDAATVTLSDPQTSGGRLRFEVALESLVGHKLPTAYPSRRAWLHVTVRDRAGVVLFDSGAFEPSGAIAGNDNDADARTFEPHYTEITRPDQVQIYEAVLVDPAGTVTTGLLTGDRYIKDNRLLPRGFDKRTADEHVAVHGAALDDPDFTAGGDRVRYAVDVAGRTGPFQVDAELWYQPIAYRWAQNLAGYDAFETQRFVRYYDSMANASAIVMAQASATTALH